MHDLIAHVEASLELAREMSVSEGSRELSLAITKLQESLHWLLELESKQNREG